MKPPIAVVMLFLSTGCSIKRLAVNQVGNALASGGSAFTCDDDPDLVAEAIPFGLQLYESLLAESPSISDFCWQRLKALPSTRTLSSIRASTKPGKRAWIAPTPSATAPASSTCEPTGTACAASKPQ